LSQLLEEKMCTEICPCDEQYKNLWNNFTEAQLNTYKRTQVVELNGTDINKYIPMYWT